MPEGPMHKQRKSKNLAVAAILFGLVALFFVGTMARMGAVG
jgi:hypothetical protein